MRVKGHEKRLDLSTSFQNKNIPKKFPCNSRNLPQKQSWPERKMQTIETSDAFEDCCYLIMHYDIIVRTGEIALL